MLIRSLALSVSLALLHNSATADTPTMTLSPLGTYSTGIFDDGAAEIIAHDANHQRLFVVNAAAAEVDVLSIANPSQPSKVTSLNLSSIGGGVNSVAVSANLVAIAVEADNKQDNGFVALFDATTLELLNTLEVGALPDMVTFTPNGKHILVANEGEPNDDYTVDPEGSVSIIDLHKGAAKATVRTADFKKFIGQEDKLRRKGVRIFGPNANAAQDLEPEFITIDKNSRTAWVSLQEANALAKVDIRKGSICKILPLGTKDHSLLGNELDASDKDDAIAIQTWPVKGFYMPDSIDSYSVKGKTYIVTANEGDSRDYDGYSEETRIEDLNLDPDAFPDAAELQLSENLGRLKTTTAQGDTDNDGDVDVLYSYGARSFSIFTGNGKLVFDSGSDFELHTATLLGENFNSNNDENDSGDKRSDDKGPEPEAVEVAQIGSQTYAFIGLERVGGIMIYNITDPRNAFFVNYVNNRNFDVDAQLEDGSSNPAVGDLGVESIVYISPANSPTNKPLLVTGNEVSGTTTVFEIK